MDTLEFAESIYLNLPYQPNDQQVKLIASLARFITDTTEPQRAYLLNGYAGTGKTSLTGALVRALRQAGRQVVLLAPTGRAAKVFGTFARYPASTIHRRIYHTDSSAGFFAYSHSLGENKLVNAIFIVDEASMIGNDSNGESERCLLSDLVEYVYSGDNCRLILLGDTAQLPPVGLDQSPAMNPDVLRGLGLKVSHAVMTRVVRQDADSGILYNATQLRRNMLVTPAPMPALLLNRFADCTAVDSSDLEDAISASYATEGEGNTLVITRSNKRAVQYNLAIRSRILGREEELCRGERLMVAKNNYLWSAKIPQLDFVANGDMAVIEAIHGTEEKYGCRYADVRLALTDRDISFECKILLDTLTSESASLNVEKCNSLYSAAMYDTELFSEHATVKTRLRMLRSDPYVNALQVKYAYAVTCHKAQGGQWPTVYVDPGFIPPDSSSLDLLRWFYTAVTRASHTLRIINPTAEILAPEE